MKKLFYLVTITGVVFFSACGGAETQDTAAPNQASTEEFKPPVPVINEADWVETDLSTVSNLIPVTVKIPKEAALEKNGNGGVDIKIAPFYVISVYNTAVSNMKEAIASGKALSVENKSYQNAKLVVDEPAGFVFTYQMKDEANGHKYEPESHFRYYLEKDGAFYSFQDQKDFDAPGGVYSEAVAKQVYGIIKSSAKVNP